MLFINNQVKLSKFILKKLLLKKSILLIYSFKNQKILFFPLISITDNLIKK